MKVVITGGGTGGHAYPAISVAELVQTKHPDWELLYLGSKGGLESQLAIDVGIRFVGLTTRRVRKLVSPDTLLTVAALTKGFFEALSALRQFKADLVIGTGGYVAAAVCLAQVVRRGKVLIHEQNVIPGRTNLLLSKFADRVCVTFEESLRYFPADKTKVTGLPIRCAFLNPPDKASARRSFGINADTFTILVLGGSQGARRINEVIAQSIPMLRDLPVQIIHQAGRRNFEEADAQRRSLAWDGYHVLGYIDDMVSAYAAADLVIGRSGASTISEITALGLPAVLIPYPFAYADHQRYNAQYLQRSGAALTIFESELTAERIFETIKHLISSPDELAKMAESSRRLGRPHAAQEVLAVAQELLEQRTAS